MKGIRIDVGISEILRTKYGQKVGLSETTWIVTKCRTYTRGCEFIVSRRTKIFVRQLHASLNVVLSLLKSQLTISSFVGVEITCWDDLLRSEYPLRWSVEFSFWDYLLRSAVEIICWDQLLRLDVQFSCWDYLLRSAVKIIWQDQRFKVIS